ncbi:MAG: hypothetical protein WHV44_04010 [Anaerolineales bacterium]
MTEATLELVTGIISFIFTLMVLSYLIGDNPLFRIAIHIFIGVSAGYAAVVAIYQVIMPNLIMPLIIGGTLERILLAFPLVLSLLLLLKLSPGAARLGNPASAYLVGVGAAVAIVGAVTGTLIPQVTASVMQFETSGANALERIFEGSIILVGTVSTLAFFHFGVGAQSTRRNPLIRLLALLGQVFIGVAFGVLFAGAYAAAVTALIERVQSILNFVMSFF